jgi:ribonuclease BN (tRNA processing enzyme)
MKLRSLGCAGGIGGELRTTSFLIDHDILIDAGTGLGELSLEELQGVDHVFITHAHLDHIACLPIMVDSVARHRDRPLTIYATEAVIATLKGHVFNWAIWPDFTQIPDPHTPFMRYQPISVGVPVMLGGRSIKAIPAEHVVPAVGYHLDSGQGSLVFSGDTTSFDAFWAYLNSIENLRFLLIETAFQEKEKEIAIVSKHLYPSLLAQGLLKLKRRADVFITHLKPGDEVAIMREIGQMVEGDVPLALPNNHILEF